jgi:predicted dehydrogenase
MDNTRRTFLKRAGAAGILLTGASALGKATNGDETQIENLSRSEPFSPNDNIQFALIGAGGMGTSDATTALQVPGTKIVAVCDLYDGRLKAAQERWGKDLSATRDYREILSRADIDAVIIGTPDHWHKKISVEALLAGKSAYCEKPMVHSIDEGAEVIAAQKKSGRVYQVGSQGLSSLGNEKAKALYESGAIGEINYAEGFWARHDPIGAWQYAIPEDGSESTVDWKRYLEPCKAKPTFDNKRFFRWRCYRDYGTGMCGDLFVHLFSSLHFIVSSNGPNRVYAAGGLRYWKDGREVPDVLIGMFDYPETPKHKPFNLSLRCNFVDGTSGTTYLKIVGSEGSMDVTWDDVTVYRNKAVSTDDSFAKLKATEAGMLNADRKRILPQEKMVYKVEEGYKGAHYDHFVNFFSAIRLKKSVVEDATFGFRAAAPALLCNDSQFENKVMNWDPLNMKLA